MRTAAAAILALALLAAPAAAAPLGLTGSWAGTWTNAAVGASGRVKLDGGPAPVLRLARGALGCAERTALPLRYRRGVLTGSGRDVPCNEGLRWSLHGRVQRGRIAATLTLRLADGSHATLTLSLRRV